MLWGLEGFFGRRHLLEMAVKICKTQKMLKLFTVLRYKPGGKSGNLCWVHLDVSLSYDVSQE